MTTLTSLSNTALTAARDCKRKYYYRYERGLQRRREHVPALHFGRLWHKMLRAWFSREKIPPPKKNDASQRAWCMFVGYLARWENDLVMCFPEQKIEAPIRNPATGRRSQRFNQFGIIDMLALHDDGKVWLWEHKTAAKIDGSYLEKLWSDAQITGYYATLRDMGIDVNGVVYDVALKPQLRQKKGETEDEFYNRIENWHLTKPEAYHREVVYISDRQVADWREDVWQVTQEILSCRRTGYWYRNTARCNDYYRQCEYAPLCQNGASETLINAEYEPRESPANDKPKTETPF